MAEAISTSLILWNDGVAASSFTNRPGRDQPRLEEVAAKACRAAKRMDEFAWQFERLLSVLRTWLLDRSETINGAHLTVRERDLLFVVVRKDARFNAELTDALTELDLSIANEPGFGLIDLEVLSVPPLSAESLRALLSFGTVLQHAE